MQINMNKFAVCKLTYHNFILHDCNIVLYTIYFYCEFKVYLTNCYKSH